MNNDTNVRHYAEIDNEMHVKHRHDASTIRSMNSEADEATDVEPDLSLPQDPGLTREDIGGEHDNADDALNCQTGSKKYAYLEINFYHNSYIIVIKK